MVIRGRARGTGTAQSLSSLRNRSVTWIALSVKLDTDIDLKFRYWSNRSWVSWTQVYSSDTLMMAVSTQVLEIDHIISQKPTLLSRPSTRTNTSFVLSETRQFSFEKRPIPQLLTSRHVRVRVVATGLCGSDVDRHSLLTFMLPSLTMFA